MTIAITRMDLDARGLRAAAARSKDVAAARRMLALALVLEGHSRTEAACATGMDRQTLRDWVHRYNAAGLEGLTNHVKPGGPPRKLTAEQEVSVAEWVRKGPTLEEHKVVRWRCCDLRDEIARHLGVEMHGLMYQTQQGRSSQNYLPVSAIRMNCAAHLLKFKAIKNTFTNQKKTIA